MLDLKQTMSFTCPDCVKTVGVFSEVIHFNDLEFPMSDQSGEEHIQNDLAPVIRIKGARTHNLQGIDVEIPIGKLTVITGVSGSGKSSLVFDTIFAEGRRRYLSSVSVTSRELMQCVERPDVDLIEGLPPVLCVEQKSSGLRKRSTVAATSDIYEYLRLLFSGVGQLCCPECRQSVKAQTRSEIVSRAIQAFEHQKVIVLAPLVRQRTGSHHDIFSRIVRDGYLRARVDGELVDAAVPPDLVPTLPHDIEIVIDRLIMKPGIRSRLEESLDLALQLGQGQCLLSHETATGWEDRLYNIQLACVACGISFPNLEPQLFSFNNVIGACSECEGIGTVTNHDGTERICDACEGTRLGHIPRSVRIDGTSITDFCSMSALDALQRVEQWTEWLSSSASHASETRRSALRHLMPEILNRLKYLIDVGMEYITLDRGSETLSAGELQRVRLASCLGSELTSVCYILDEPTAGLHPSDTIRLLKSLSRLRDAGNTLLIVEHDLEVIRSADYVIDLGPGAGQLGGRVLAFGTPDDLIHNSNSITGPFLKSGHEFEIRSKRGSASASGSASIVSPPEPVLRLSGATLHNLKNITVEIPLRRFVCVTGGSGSGKSSLIMQTLVPAVRRALGERTVVVNHFIELTGIQALSKLVQVDQSPLGRSSRSSPATYSGLWDEVRSVFAKTRESRLRGYTSRRFSLNVPEARCARCLGRGQLSVDEKRFADWQVRCPECDGQRFAASTLSIRYKNRSVADVLAMSFTEAALFFENFPRLTRTLNVFNELGLGYLKMGQAVSTLSGGEAQRVKLGTELAKSTGMEGSTLFVLDEPTAGLHVADVRQLVVLLRRLVAEGHSVLVIEHNPELIGAADWQIEIGPGAGRFGGSLVRSSPTSRLST